MWSFPSDLSSWTQCQKHFEARNMQQKPCHPRHSSLLSQVYMQISLYTHSHLSQPRRKASSWPFASKTPISIMNPLKNKTESEEQKQKINIFRRGRSKQDQISGGVYSEGWKLTTLQMMDEVMTWRKWRVLHFYFIPLLTVNIFVNAV